MSKTPYEIRLDLLRLAKESLFEPYFYTRSNKELEWNAQRDANPNAPFPEMPTAPTSEDIIAEAKKLNEFVSRGE
jgi:hypothetical protein